jgi:hypothetical protein
VNFKYILLDVNRYREETLKQFPNLIKAVFLLDQRSAPENFIRRLKEIAGFLETLILDDYSYFKAWMQTIAARGLSEQTATIVNIIAESKPEEVVQMVYNFIDNMGDERRSPISRANTGKARR